MPDETDDAIQKDMREELRLVKEALVILRELVVAQGQRIDNLEDWVKNRLEIGLQILEKRVRKLEDLLAG